MPKGKASLYVIAFTMITVATLFLFQSSPAVYVQTTQIQSGSLVKTAALSGKVSYVRQQPCITLRDGKLAQVLVSPGQKVRKGELLFRMDTEKEEQLLSRLSQTRYEQKQSIAALATVREVELIQAEEEIKWMVEAAQVRAQMDGVVEAVYAAEGDEIPSSSLLAMIRSEEKGAVVTLDKPIVANVATMTGNKGEKIGSAVLQRMEAVSAGETLIQRAFFVPLVDDALNEWEIGQTLTVEWVENELPSVALIPIEAVGEDDKVWVIENGIANPVKIEVGQKNGRYVAAKRDWMGKSVVIDPEKYDLYAGIQVCEARE